MAGGGGERGGFKFNAVLWPEISVKVIDISRVDSPHSRIHYTLNTHLTSALPLSPSLSFPLCGQLPLVRAYTPLTAQGLSSVKEKPKLIFFLSAICVLIKCAKMMNVHAHHKHRTHKSTHKHTTLLHLSSVSLFL